MDWSKVHIIYFLGIGGIGMSALVRYFLHAGKEVHGYDLTSTPLTIALENEGAYIHYREDPGKIPAATDLVIYTPAIPAENTELQWIRSSDIPLLKRAEVVGLLASDHFSIAVAGTHGKTSISAIASHIIKSAGLKITAFVGGIMKNYGTNVLLTDPAEYLLVEADEFDRSFLQLMPDIALISSMDADHLDIYGHHDELTKGFELFAGRVAPDGLLIRNERIPLKTRADRNLSYGSSEHAEVRSTNIRIENGRFVFDIQHGLGVISDISMEIPGMHYVENAAGAAAIALHLNIREPLIKAALQSFRGVERRFEFILNTGRVVYIDDYAHHPEEIRATLETLALLYPNRRKTGVFQPHLFSRTKDFAREFATALEVLDEVILLPIYPAREKPIPGVTSEMLLEGIKNPNKKLVEKENLLTHLSGSPLDVLITMGAGDIGLMTGKIKEMLMKK